MCLAEKVYEQIDPRKWERIKQAARPYGIEISSATGTGNAFGVEFLYRQDEVAEKLHVGIINGGYVSPTEALNFLDGIISKA